MKNYIDNIDEQFVETFTKRFIDECLSNITVVKFKIKKEVNFWNVDLFGKGGHIFTIRLKDFNAEIVDFYYPRVSSLWTALLSGKFGREYVCKLFNLEALSLNMTDF